ELLARERKRIANFTQEFMPGHGIADFHRARRTDRVGAAMALDDHAVKAEKHPAVDIARIHLGLQCREGMARQKIADLRYKIAAKRFAQIFRYLIGRTFRGLQGDIAGEAFGDHDIDRTLANIVAFDETPVVEVWQTGLAQQAGGGLDLVDALDFLDTDIQQTHGRPFDAKDDPGHRGTHPGEIHKMPCIGADRRPEIEDDRLAPDRGPDRRYRRAADPR